MIDMLSKTCRKKRHLSGLVCLAALLRFTTHHTTPPLQVSTGMKQMQATAGSGGESSAVPGTGTAENGNGWSGQNTTGRHLPAELQWTAKKRLRRALPFTSVLFCLHDFSQLQPVV